MLVNLQKNQNNYKKIQTKLGDKNIGHKNKKK